MADRLSSKLEQVLKGRTIIQDGSFDSNKVHFHQLIQHRRRGFVRLLINTPFLT